jgi:ADP-dependent NAD(P)H-hydrate dehydratase / NAD(P)H-hydrate epimerase
MNEYLYLSPRLREIEAAQAHLPLMARAGEAAANWAVELAGGSGYPILVMAGPGNNGGDALVAACHLRQRFFDVQVVFTGDQDALPPDAANALRQWRDTGGQLLEAIPPAVNWSLIIDGLFGIGLTRAPASPFAERIDAINQQARQSDCPVLALDCPSGLDADRGTLPGKVVRATHTLTFIALKPGLLTGDGPDACGQIRLATLGLDAFLPALPAADGHVICRSQFEHCLRPRLRNSHKGSFGGAGILGGGKSMVGAALLASRAALKLGAGRVYLGLLDPDPLAVDPGQPELMVRRADNLLQAELQVLGCGPGLGHSGEAIRLVEQALKCPLPVVLDADALNILASDGRLEGNLYNRIAPAVLTPHPAEAARLLGSSVREIQADRLSAARELARRYGCHIALKGCGTVIVTVDGRWWLNTTGNPGMATAGMGDVLTGLIVSLIAQGWPADAALVAAVHLHGAAADHLVSTGIGPIGLTAGEVIDAARAVFNGWIAQRTGG